MRETKQNGMRVRLFGALLALAGGAVLAGHAAPASAATTTTVTCFKPVTQISTGQGGTFDQPRWTLQCLGGSTASNVTFFAWRLADDPYVAPLLEEASWRRQIGIQLLLLLALPGVSAVIRWAKNQLEAPVIALCRAAGSVPCRASG